ncbi:MAG: hypothetical protein RIQ96_1824 [Pseudomonadota bacterium]|jgi:prephenate dehydratase
MALRDLITAAQTLEAARQAIGELQSEQQRNLDRNAAIAQEIAAKRAQAEAAIVVIQDEAPNVTAP